jgi:hypothetical protein
MNASASFSFLGKWYCTSVRLMPHSSAVADNIGSVNLRYRP